MTLTPKRRRSSPARVVRTTLRACGGSSHLSILQAWRYNQLHMRRHEESGGGGALPAEVVCGLDLLSRNQTTLLSRRGIQVLPCALVSCERSRKNNPPDEPLRWSTPRSHSSVPCRQTDGDEEGEGGAGCAVPAALGPHENALNRHRRRDEFGLGTD